LYKRSGNSIIGLPSNKPGQDKTGRESHFLKKNLKHKS
jgi:hypothetical protein